MNLDICAKQCLSHGLTIKEFEQSFGRVKCECQTEK